MAISKVFSGVWGWSKLDNYRACPQQFKFKHIDKLKESASIALQQGTEKHEAVEKYLNGWSDILWEGLSPTWVRQLKVLRGRKPMTEAAWGVDRKWQPLKDWFEPTVWCRAKSDVYYVDKNTLVLIDIKSGKYRVPSTDQMELYAIIGHVFFPDVKNVRTSFWFVDQDEAPLEEVYEPKKLINLRGKYEQELIKGMYKDKRFAPKPGAACRFCSFSRQKGGPCQY